MVATRIKPEPEQESQQAPDPKRIIEIDVVAPERPYAVIDGERHEFRLRQEFGATEDREFTRYSAEYDELWAVEKKLSREATKRYEWLLDWLFDHVLVNSKALREQLAGDTPTGQPRLSGGIKREIVLSFSNAPQLMAILKEAAARTSEQTGQEPEANLSTFER